MSNMVRNNLLQRDFDLDLHQAWIDEEEQVATFPLWTLTGQMAGYQQYRPFATKEKRNDPKDGRYFTYRLKTQVAVWGMESWYLSPDLLFVVEGVFDATRLTKRGVSALAVLSNNPTGDTRAWLLNQPRKVVTVCDADSGGSLLARSGHEAVVVPSGDLGDAPATWVDGLVRRYTNA